MIIAECWGHKGSCINRSLGKSRMLNKQGSLQKGGDKILFFPTQRLRVNFINYLVIFLLYIQAKLSHFLLQRQTSHKSPRMVISDASLSRPLPILRGDFKCTLQPSDLYAVLLSDHNRVQVFQLCLNTGRIRHS